MSSGSGSRQWQLSLRIVREPYRLSAPGKGQSHVQNLNLLAGLYQYHYGTELSLQDLVLDWGWGEGEGVYESGWRQL